MSAPELKKWHIWVKGEPGRRSWVRDYDGWLLHEREIPDLLSDEVLTALLREKRRQRQTDQ